MNRSSQTSAIILSIKASEENNSTVTVLTPDRGIIYATLYGGPKSKLRSLVSVWNSGTIWLYENSEKKQIKINDFEVHNYHSTFSENLYKNFAASLEAELAIKTHCGGSSEQFFTLISGLYDGMNLCDEQQSRLGLIRFLWRFLELMGIQPQTEECGSCGDIFSSSRFEKDQLSYYNVTENCFNCMDCGGTIPIKIAAVRYLSAVTSQTPSEVRRLSIDEESYQQIKEVVFFLIENSLDQKLNTLETGVGIL